MTRSRGIRVRRGTRSAWVKDNQGRYVCQCGCGEPIPLKAEHFNTGVPRYLHGHNAKANPPNKRPPKPRSLCACGCGATTAPGRRYLSGHSSRGRKLSSTTRRRISASRTGKNVGRPPPNYRGRTRHAAGYIQMPTPGHPFGVGPSSYVMEHRLVMEEHLRLTDPDSPYLIRIDGELYLRREIECHHIDGVRDNNAPENLQLVMKAEHTALHMAGNTWAKTVSPRQEEMIRRLADPSLGLSQRAIGRAAGVSHKTVGRILAAGA